MITPAVLRHAEAAKVWNLRNEIVDQRMAMRPIDSSKAGREAHDLAEQARILGNMAEAIEEEIPSLYNLITYLLATYPEVKAFL